MRFSILFSPVGYLVFLATVTAAFAQVAPPSRPFQVAPPAPAQPALQNQAVLQAYQSEQGKLVRAERDLVEKGATPQQVDAWRQQNAAILSLQEQRAEAMAITGSLSLRLGNKQANVPPNASPALKDLLAEQAMLSAARAQINSQMMQRATASDQKLTFVQINKIEQQENQLFQQQDTALLKTQEQRAQVLSDTSDKTVVPVPAATVIPPNTSPQMAAYLTTRDQIRRGAIQLRNQYADADPAVREAAMQKWREENADKFAQLQQQAQSLAQAGRTTQN